MACRLGRMAGVNRAVASHVSSLRASIPHACALRLPAELHGKDSPAQQTLILTALSSEGASVAHTHPLPSFLLIKLTEAARKSCWLNGFPAFWIRRNAEH